MLVANELQALDEQLAQLGWILHNDILSEGRQFTRELVNIECAKFDYGLAASPLHAGAGAQP